MVTSTQTDTNEVVKSEAEKEVAASRVESRRVYAPAVDIVESESEVLLVADMPGVASGDVTVSLERSVLTVKGKAKAEDASGKTLIRSEYGVGDFERSFTLSDDIDKEQIAAEMKDGVLRVRLPKAAQVCKKITVTAS